MKEIGRAWKEESRKGIIWLGIAVGVLSWDEEWVMMLSYVLVMVIIIQGYGKRIGEYIDEECRKEIEEEWRRWERIKQSREEEGVEEELKLWKEENKERIERMNKRMEEYLRRRIQERMRKYLEQIEKVDRSIELEEERVGEWKMSEEEIEEGIEEKLRV
uniref:ATP synthase F1F0 subunit B n=1 Tax=Galdieria sulphuraria TaxID=130081 RepID=A0A7H0WB40_GALSU|nr:ATP synthase F1F0 subunit B [Galdieria yellowstonensis]